MRIHPGRPPLSLYWQLPENLIHHPLEGRRRVAETKEHDSGLKQAPVGPEGGLPLVSFLDPHVVVSPPNVQLGEVPGSTQLVHQLLDERQRVPVFDSEVIQLAIVLDRSQRPICLLDEEEGRGHGGIGGSDPP